MKILLRLSVFLSCFLLVTAMAEQNRDQVAVKPTLEWLSDPSAAYALSKETGRPILLVFR